MKNFENENIVTRVDTRETEDGNEVRLFHKRKLLHRFGEDDVVREGFEDEIPAFLLAKPRTVEDVENFLTSEAGEEDEGEEEAGGSIVPEKYRVRYGAPQNCGDEIALTLTDYVTEPRIKKNGKADIDGGLNRELLREVANANGIGAKLQTYEDKGLNGGLLRMNVSNILRGMNRRGERVVIGDTEFPAREVEKKARKRKPAKATAKAK